MSTLFDSCVSRVLLAPTTSVCAQDAVRFRPVDMTQIAHRRWPERFWITRLGRSSSSGRVWRHRLPLTALVLTTMMWDGIAHAASVSVPPSSNVPVYNIQATCREVSSISEARLSESGEPDATKRCTDDENRAREQLLERWPKFKAADRTMCAGASRSGTVSPSYTELITCLEMTRDHYGSKMKEARQRAQSELRESAAVGLSAPSPVAIVRAQPVSQSTESVQQVSDLDRSPTPSSEKGVDTGAQVAELNQTIENLRSELESSARTVARFEKEKQDAERGAAQAEQARRDAEGAKLGIEEVRVAKTILKDSKNHGPALLAYTTLVGLVILLAIGASARRRRAVSARST